MGSGNGQEIFEKVARLLRQQKEMYGDFEISFEKQSDKDTETQSVISEPIEEFKTESQLSIEEKLAVVKHWRN